MNETATQTRGREKRQHQRALSNLRVVFRLRGGSAITKDLPPVDAVTRNISEGGVFIELGDKRIAPDHSITAESFLLLKSTILLQLDLSDGGPPVPAEGRAVWVEKPVEGQAYNHGVAVQFLKLKPEDRKRIAALVARSPEAP